MNLNLVDSAVRFVKRYPLDGEFICWMVLSQPFIQLEPVFYDHEKILDTKYLSNVPTNDVHCPDPHKHLSSLWFVLIGWHNYLVLWDSTLECSNEIKWSIYIFFSQALELQPGYKVCLVQRSKCYLRLGNADAALRDAEESLAEDKEYNKVWKPVNTLNH